MRVDNLDFKIIEILDKYKNITSYGVTKEIFKNINDVRVLRDKKRPIDSRLKKLVKYKIINNKKICNVSFYRLNKRNVIFSDNVEIKIKNKKYRLVNKIIVFKVNGSFYGVLI